MGSKPCNPEEGQEMAKEACKLMMTKIVPKTLEASQEVHIAAPEKELAAIKKMAVDLRAASTEAKAQVNAAGHHAAESVEKLAQGAGGALGSLLSKAAGAVESVVDKTAEVAGGGLEAALGHLADALDKQLKALDEKFASAGKDIVSSKSADIQTVYTELIASCEYTNAVDWCQCKGDNGISSQFHEAMMAQLTAKLLPMVQATASSGVIQAWNSSITSFNSANEKLGSHEWGAKFKQPTISLDINKYIADTIAQQLCVVMGQKEKDVRAFASNDKLLYAVLATEKKPITKEDYTAWKKGSF